MEDKCLPARKNLNTETAPIIIMHKPRVFHATDESGGGMPAPWEDTHPVTGRDAFGRIEDIVYSLCSQGINTQELAGELGVGLRRLDVPKNVNLVPLYKLVNVNNVEGAAVHTFCLGLRPLKGDPEVRNMIAHWNYADYPEWSDNGTHVPKNVSSSLLNAAHATCFGKAHVVNQEGANPFMFLYPTQLTTPQPREDVLDQLQRMMAKGIETNDRRGVREVEHRIRLMREHPKASAFRHGDRNLALDLVQLKAARALGIRDVRLPSTEFLKRYGHIGGEAGQMIMAERGDEVTFVRRYRQAKEFLEKASGFNVTMWDGKISPKG